MHVRFVDLSLQFKEMREEIHRAVDEVGESGHYVLGPHGERFERELAAYCGTRHAVALGNGSDALFLALKALGVGPGDEVITAPNSFIASAWTIANTGARVVFADVLADTMNLDPSALEKAVTARTRAVMPVHLTGRIADMEAIGEVAQRHGLAVIEDAAQAIGARRRGARAGSLGRCAGFSLHPLKNLHVYGDGGALTSDDDELVERVRRLRNHGLINRDLCGEWGINSRLDELQAAVLARKLPRLDGWNERFRAIAARYTAELGDVIAVPTHESYEEPIYHRFMVRSPRRDELARFLEERGVETRVNYPIPLHLQPAAASLGYREGDFPVCEELSRTILSLPVYAELEDGAVEHVIRSVRAFS